MVADDGLASVACESRPSRVLMRIAVVVDLLACYFIITEVRHDLARRVMTLRNQVHFGSLFLTSTPGDSGASLLSIRTHTGSPQ